MFHAAVKHGINNADVYFMLGMAHYQQGEVLYALPHFQRAVELKEEDAEARFQYGLCLAHLEQVDPAIKQFEKALERMEGSGTADVYYNLGVAYAYKDNLEAALKAFEKALVLQPGHHLAANGKKLTEKRLSEH